MLHAAFPVNTLALSHSDMPSTSTQAKHKHFQGPHQRIGMRPERSLDGHRPHQVRAVLRPEAARDPAWPTNVQPGTQCGCAWEGTGSKTNVYGTYPFGQASKPSYLNQCTTVSPSLEIPPPKQLLLAHSPKSAALTPCSDPHQPEPPPLLLRLE